MTSRPAPPAPALPCPECEASGRPGRIGSQRSSCKLCNRWAQGVIRATHAMLRQYEPEVFQALREQAEIETYQRVTREETSDDQPSTGPGDRRER